MKKKPKKQIPEQIATDSDEHFAYIAGYTESGAPYGVTCEEMEAIERSAVVLPRSVPFHYRERSVPQVQGRHSQAWCRGWLVSVQG